MPTQQFNTTADANGRAVIEIMSRPKRWSVQQVNLKMPTAQAGTVCEISKNGETGLPVAAARDSASGSPYHDLEPTDVLSIVWTGGPANAPAEASIIYEVL